MGALWGLCDSSQSLRGLNNLEILKGFSLGTWHFVGHFGSPLLCCFVSFLAQGAQSGILSSSLKVQELDRSVHMARHVGGSFSYLQLVPPRLRDGEVLTLYSGMPLFLSALLPASWFLSRCLPL